MNVKLAMFPDSYQPLGQKVTDPETRQHRSRFDMDVPPSRPSPVPGRLRAGEISTLLSIHA
jgi:hypothetical protein